MLLKNRKSIFVQNILVSLILASSAGAAFAQDSGRARATADNDILEVGGDKIYIKFGQQTDAWGLSNGNNGSNLSSESAISVDLGVGPARLQVVEVEAEGTLIESNGSATESIKETAFRFRGDDIAIDTASSVSDTSASISKSLSREFFRDSGSLKIKDYTPNAVDAVVGNSTIAFSGGISGIFKAVNSVTHKSRTSGADRINDLESKLSLEANLNGSLFGAFLSGDVDIIFDLDDAVLLSGSVQQSALARSTKHANTTGRTMYAEAGGTSNLQSPKVEAMLEGEVDTFLGDLEVEEEVTLWSAVSHNNKTLFSENDEEVVGNIDPPIDIVPFSTLYTVDVNPCKALKLSSQVSTSSNDYNEAKLCSTTHRRLSTSPVRFSNVAGNTIYANTYAVDVSSSEPSQGTAYLSNVHSDKYWAFSMSVGNNLAPGARIQIQAKIYNRCNNSRYSNWSEVYTTVENARVFALDTQKLMKDAGSMCLSEDLLPENRIMYRVRYETDSQSGPWAYLRPILMRLD